MLGIKKSSSLELQKYKKTYNFPLSFRIYGNDIFFYFISRQFSLLAC